MLRALLVLIVCALPVSAGALADVTGRWRVTISFSDRSIEGVASLEQSGDKVTGAMGPSETDTTAVSGIVKGDKLTLKTHPKPGFEVPFDTCELTISGDRMTGSLATASSKSTIEFARAR